MPEAAEGGPLAIVRDGDRIDIDLEARQVHLALSDLEITRRISEWDGEIPQAPRGWLGIYRSLVRPLSEGARLAPPQPGAGRR
jgi:dihydroxy-acid dehydratase